MTYWLDKSDKPTPLENVHADGSSRSQNGPCRIGITGLTAAEFASVESALLGVTWVRVVEGRMQAAPAKLPLPDPTADLLMTPHWSGDREHDWLGQPEITRTRNVREFDKASNCSASILIHGITAAVSNPKERDSYYVASANKLESWGFECMRSRRGKDGRFWELWYLPGLYASKGELAKAIEPAKESGVAAEVKASVRFLMNCSVPWGSVDVCCQRAAITFD